MFVQIQNHTQDFYSLNAAESKTPLLLPYQNWLITNGAIIESAAQISTPSFILRRWDDEVIEGAAHPYNKVNTEANYGQRQPIVPRTRAASPVMTRGSLSITCPREEVCEMVHWIDSSMLFPKAYMWMGSRVFASWILVIRRTMIRNRSCLFIRSRFSGLVYIRATEFAITEWFTTMNVWHDNLGEIIVMQQRSWPVSSRLLLKCFWRIMLSLLNCSPYGLKRTYSWPPLT